MTEAQRNDQLAHVAKAHGAQYSLRIIWEVRRANALPGKYKLPISAGFALIEGESGFRNVFGHDNTSSIPESWKGGRVTRQRYESYKARRATHGAQGVGPGQPTWPPYQDRADEYGGCHKVAPNIRVSMEILHGHLQDSKGDLREAFRRYNGSGRKAIKYASDQMERYRKWHGIFNREAR